jgi:hypothetical protein
MRSWIVGIAIGLLLSGSIAQRLWVVYAPADAVGSSVFPRLSKNGQVLATSFTFVGTDYRPRPALWRAQTGWQFLRADGSLTSNWREAVVGYLGDISYDGTVVTYMGNDIRTIFRWRMGVGVQALPASGQHGYAYLSWDGAYVVGHYGGYYVRWDAQGRMERLFAGE